MAWKRWVSRILLGGLGLVLLGVVSLAVVGVPKPPSATVSGVPRLPWSPAFSAANLGLASLDGVAGASWTADGEGLYVSGFHRLQPRILRLSEPGAEPELVDVPPRAHLSGRPDPALNSVIYSLDRGGDEQRRLFRVDLDSGEHLPLTPPGHNAWIGPWSRDGRLLAFASNERDPAHRDLYVMDPLHPADVRRVYEGEGAWSVRDWSADGGRLLISQYVSVSESRPHVLDLETGMARPLVPLDAPAAYRSPCWSSDPSVVFMLTDRDAEFSRLVRVDVDEGTLEPFGPPAAWDFSALACSHDRRRWAVAINEGGYMRWYRLDPSTGARTPLRGPDGFEIAGLRLHPSRNEAAVTLVDGEGGRSVGVLGLDDGSYTPWSMREEADAPLPPVRSIRYPTFDEVDGRPRTIPAFVHDPPSESPTPAPVIIRIHGGPEGQSMPRPNVLYDALRREFGVAIITPNVRGSRGYGKTYLGLDDGRRREDSVRDIGALLEWIAEQPDLDADRVIVYGGSYGGYMVLASLVHFPDRIRCGVDVVGISDFVTFLENTEDYRRDLRRAEYGDERDPTMRTFLESISPLRRADEIEADLLVIQGANDPRVPAEESRQIVARLRELGREVWYVEFDDEGHGVQLPLNAAYTAMVGGAFARHCLER